MALFSKQRGVGGTYEHTYVHTHVWTENSPCVIQDIVPFGAAAQKDLRSVYLLVSLSVGPLGHGFIIPLICWWFGDQFDIMLMTHLMGLFSLVISNDFQGIFYKHLEKQGQVGQWCGILHCTIALYYCYCRCKILIFASFDKWMTMDG